MVYTYLLRSEKLSRFYTGISIDPWRRLTEHNRGNLKTTRSGRPWTLVYARPHATYKDARQNERWLKKKGQDYKLQLAQLAPPTEGGVK